MLRSHSLNLIWPSMNRILVFFLFIYISFLSAHISLMSIALSRFFIPTLLVSSAKICGCNSFSLRISSVKSLVKILNRRHEIPQPYPSPLPMWTLPNSDYITKLLNISWIPVFFIPIYLLFSFYQTRVCGLLYHRLSQSQ